MKVQIRAATEVDLPSILALYVEVEDDGRVLSIEQARSILARMKSYPDYKVYVAMLGRSIVGTFALLIMDNLAHMGAPSGVVEDVVVHRDWRGKGVGKQMMRFPWIAAGKEAVTSWHCRATSSGRPLTGFTMA